MSPPRPTAPPDDHLQSVLEAVLFASGDPVPVQDLMDAFPGLEESEILTALDALGRSLREAHRGLRLERVGGGFRLTTVAEVGEWVRQFFRQRNRTRLSRAALETLAIVAYRQPITAPEIQAIRGVDPSAALRSLVEKKMVRILGKKKVVGSPLLYGTTRQFLIHFGLDALEDLPPIEEFEALVDALGGDSSGSLFGTDAPSAEEATSTRQADAPREGEEAEAPTP